MYSPSYSRVYVRFVRQYREQIQKLMCQKEKKGLKCKGLNLSTGMLLFVGGYVVCVMARDQQGLIILFMHSFIHWFRIENKVQNVQLNWIFRSC